MRSSTGSDSGIISEMLKTKSGKIGIAMLLALVLLSVSVLVSTPIDTLQEWNDPSVWQRPKSAMNTLTRKNTVRTYVAPIITGKSSTVMASK